MDDVLKLDPVLNLKAAAPPQAALIARRGQPLEIDASAVQRLGGLCLQVLLSAQKTWAEDGGVFGLVNGSEAFGETLRLLGAEARFDEFRVPDMGAK
jgi:chemotaxis protein CheX